ncbi:MAG: RNA polymerase sigma factor [Steroidobacterales bacterium]
MQQAGQELIGSDEFVPFMRAYQDMVYSTVVRLLGMDAQAEDIAQEVFLKAYENFAMLRDSATPGGWLKTVATNLSLNHLSRYRRRWSFFSEFRRNDDGDGAAGNEPGIDVAIPDTLFDDLAAAERATIVEHALARLPDHQRIALVLYHFEDMPYADIARRLNVSLSKVKIDIMRGRAVLAQALTVHGPATVLEEGS